MLKETQSNRLRDTRREVDRWLVERIKAKQSRKNNDTSCMVIMPPVTMSEVEVAELLGYGRDVVRRIMRRELPHTKVGKCWHYQVRDVVSWMVQKEMEMSK